MNRATVTRLLVDRLRDEVVVANLGEATQELQNLDDRPLNCYTFGAMGQCSSMAVGIALARPDVKVICLDGDGSMLMNLGVLCTTANLSPPNLALVVLDNERYATTGGQATATAFRTDLAEVARGAGFEKVLEPQDEEELESAYERVLNEDGPFFLCVKIDGTLAAGSTDRNIIGYKQRFMKALDELAPAGSRA